MSRDKDMWDCCGESAEAGQQLMATVDAVRLLVRALDDLSDTVRFADWPETAIMALSVAEKLPFMTTYTLRGHAVQKCLNCM